VDGAPENWLDEIEGIETARAEGPGMVLRVGEAFDESRLVHHALSVGHLRAFHRRRKGLPELFRHYVSAEQTVTDQASGHAPASLAGKKVTA
jgi:hypothetical protein